MLQCRQFYSGKGRHLLHNPPPPTPSPAPRGKISQDEEERETANNFAETKGGERREQGTETGLVLIQAQWEGGGREDTTTRVKTHKLGGK